VMFYHFWKYAGDNAVGAALTHAASSGWAGVDVFFVLSGFLITGILLDSRTDKGRWRTFYIRRGLRIFPLYYAVLTGLLILQLAVERYDLPFRDPSLANIENIWVNYLYLTDFSIVIHGSNWAPLDISWSLAVEEQFYLVYPFVVWGVRQRRLMGVLIGAVVFAALFRAGSFILSGENLRTAYALPLSRMDQLAMGGIACLLIRHHKDVAAMWARRLALPLIAAASVLLLTLTREDLAFVIAGYFTTAAATTALMIWIVCGGARPLARVLRAAPLVWVGKVSYGLYLLHLFAAAAVLQGPLKGALSGDSLAMEAARVGLMSAVALVLAWLSWTLFERPILGLKNRWAPRATASN